jgi:AraC-like DNA-binding protein
MWSAEIITVTTRSRVQGVAMGIVRPTLLWVDLTVSDGPARPPRAIHEVFDIKQVSDVDLDGQTGVGGIADAICMDYDYPDIPGLSLLKQTKKLYPSTPIIMLTVQHSEELAVWSFRASVWDYLVKPVSLRDANRCLDGLIKVLEIRDAQRDRAITACSPPLPREARFRPSGGGSHVSPALAYISSNFCRKIQEKDVASICSLSPYRFSRVFKTEVGVTFQEYLVRFRLDEACRLMMNPAASLTDIAYTVGFNSPSYFSRAFRQVFATSPSDYRETITERLALQSRVALHAETFDEDRFYAGAIVGEVTEQDYEGRYLRAALDS